MWNWLKSLFIPKKEEDIFYDLVTYQIDEDLDFPEQFMEEFKLFQEIAIDECLRYELPAILIHFQKMSKERKRSKFLKKKSMLGIERSEQNKIDIYIDEGCLEDPSAHSDTLLWLLFHEFRHIIQKNYYPISATLFTESWDNFFSYMCGGKRYRKRHQDTIAHALHEINPVEVDANIYANTLTNHISFSSAFTFNRKMINWMKREMKKADEKSKRKKTKKKTTKKKSSSKKKTTKKKSPPKKRSKTKAGKK